MFMIVNVAVVDTDLSNGAMGVMPGTHRREYKYWQLLAERPRRQRMCMKAGDALVRPSTLWHRGMPNPSRTARPMLAFTWEDGGSKLPDPYEAHEGRIAFLPNRYATDWKGRLIERAYITAPSVASAIRAVRSFF
jgi:ectoine hydroxylase-related dioxygenase (phytanoyl-CoA dioxygenase family)